MSVNYELLPEHIREAARIYIEEHQQPGSFLSAVICNDLKETFARADDTNQRRMYDIVNFFYCEAPSECWGSEEAMAKWLSGETP